MVPAEIEVQIFSLDAPAWGEQIFDAATNGPSIKPVVVVVRRPHDTAGSDTTDPEVGIEEGPTALGVKQGGTNCVADTARYVRVEVGIVFRPEETGGSNGKAVIRVVGQARAAEIGFDT